MNLNELKSNLQEATRKLNDRMNELYNEGNAYPEIDAEVTRSNEEILSTTNEIERLRRETLANVLSFRRKNIESSINNVDIRLNDRTSELYNEENAYPEMDTTIQNLNAELSGLRSNLDNLNRYAESNNLISNLDNYESNLKNLQEQLDARMNELYNEGNAYPEMDSEVIRLRDEVSAYNRNISHLQELLNQGHLTENILNEITLPDMHVNISTDEIENTNVMGNEKNEEIDSQIHSNEKTIEDMISDKEAELRACADRMKDCKDNGFDEAYAMEKANFDRISRELSDLRNEVNIDTVDPQSFFEEPKLNDSEESNNATSTQNEENTADSNNTSENKKPDKENELEEPEEENELTDDDLQQENENEIEKANDDEKKKARKEKLKKAAWFALGATAGVGLSFVVQPGVGGLIISGGRLAYAIGKKAIKVYTEKHKDDENNRIVKLVTKAEQKISEIKQKQMEKHPKITAAVIKVNNFLKKPETQLFINGMATGYTLGKIGQSVGRLIEANTNHVTTMEYKEHTKMSGTSNIDNNVNTNITQPDISIDAPVDTFDPSKPIDLSSLKNGFVSSYDNTPVSMLTEAGKNVTFDKINIVDGKTMIHFNQANGLGYGWFPADDVMKALNISDISELTETVAGGLTK